MASDNAEKTKIFQDAKYGLSISRNRKSASPANSVFLNTMCSERTNVPHDQFYAYQAYQFVLWYIHNKVVFGQRAAVKGHNIWFAIYSPYCTERRQRLEQYSTSV